ncbi:BZ3500_MvSof-1268-A1-R1_Chr7-3g09585 [Microbotryum saponariae]|uniref:BZ3500_MvSof-1268-A1-R1_Chr7-3g09585 protein n=1 Tax=Microbotryum saponariae TaxID=289078 RepID=A0A2X0MY77_9BASI|nr:BZ3501_MvSof-1269-A2-R1_Chr7-2g09308 [Microbotryum saponariae]SDA02244.1 BZ3500_MvSof-1268-A1-R1_Chr7-3g09585 [Microbotryum saponariae]
MQRTPRCFALASAATTRSLVSLQRPFSSVPPLQSKASKSRSKKTKLLVRQPTAVKIAVAPGSVAGPSNKGKASTAPRGLLEEEEEPSQPIHQAPEVITTSSVDGASAKEVISDHPEVVDAKLSTVSSSHDEPHQNQEEEETIYTSPPPFNVPLLMSACFAFSVFSLSAADIARTGYASYDEDKEAYELASPWKRYTFAGGFVCVSVGLVLWGTLAPGRVITKLTIRRGPTATKPMSSIPLATRYPPTSLVSIHTPLTRLPIVGGRPRQVELHRLVLLGPLAQGPKSWHPAHHSPIETAEKKRNNPVSRGLANLSELLIAPSKPTSPSDRWKNKGTLSHVPLLVHGDRFSYTLGKRRAGKQGDLAGAWCEDWEGFEKALLGKK